MDPRLLDYYERELQHVREMGAEFAQAYPKIASRLGIETLECADPYVERLLESFAFLAARVQLKLDAEFPTFTQHLLDMVYPDYLGQTPSMAITRFEPDLSKGALTEGFVIPRHSTLEGQQGPEQQTACQYRTAHDVTLWPLAIEAAAYIANTATLPAIARPAHRPAAKAGLRLRLRVIGDANFNELALDDLAVFLRGTDELPMQIYEQLLGNAVAMVVQPAGDAPSWREVYDPSHIRSLGFEPEQALMPWGPRSFQGYRLLREYFAFPARFMFVEFTGLQRAVRRCPGRQLDIIILFDRVIDELEHTLNTDHFALFCTPAVNLFPKRSDRIKLDITQSEYHLTPELHRPMDFEIYQVTSVTGYGDNKDQQQTFYPFYASHHQQLDDNPRAFYTVRRQPRLLSTRQRRHHARSNYLGTELFISLVDANHAPLSPELRQLAADTWCTNRDLPLFMPIGKGDTDFNLSIGAPITSIRCVAGPTAPKPSPADGGNTAWRLINHLRLNYLSLTDSNEESGAVTLRDLLMLYGDSSDAAVRHQIEGLRAIANRPVVARAPVPGPISFARGMEVTITFDESLFRGTGVFLLGAVLERFFSQYVALNTFSETVIKTVSRGQIMRWPARIGQCQTL